jgi:hypothetical protein
MFREQPKRPKRPKRTSHSSEHSNPEKLLHHGWHVSFQLASPSKPPPMAEDQLGPQSPIAALSENQAGFANFDKGASRRIRPGTKAEDMAEGPPLVALGEV